MATMSIKPNVVYIYADDLGHGMLSCYGQQQFRTPNIDRLAGEGVLFRRAYGTAFCAPARASLLTGMHDVHAGRWTFNKACLYENIGYEASRLEDLYESINNTGIRPRDGQTFLATVAKRAGLVTGQIGKLEWGFSTTPQQLEQHGWDYHYGYYDHGSCHGYYPNVLFENGKAITIPGNTRWRCGAHYDHGESVPHDPEGRAVYSQDLFDEKIVEFIRTNRDRPFFLYHPSQLPHGPAYFPKHDPQVAGKPDLLPVEIECASMILRLDQTVGVILDELEALGLSENTLILFASDNGHRPNYEVPGRCSVKHDLNGSKLDELNTKFYTESCGDVFDGNGGLAGLKATNWEGGARIPFMVRWKGRIEGGRVSHHLLANYDTMATLADLLGVPLRNEETDGISYLPALLGREDAPGHEYVVYASGNGPSLVTAEGWKLRVFLKLDRVLQFPWYGTSLDGLQDAYVLQLYNLNDDPSEKKDVSAENPDRVRRLLKCLMRECDGNLVHGTPQAHFAFSV